MSTSKRDALIEATKNLLWERGYEAMSPKAVLKASGAGQGSLYHHFEGKRELAATALEELNIDMRQALDDYLGDSASPLARLISYLQVPREALKGCRFGRLANEQAIADPVLNPLVQRYFLHLEQRLAETVEQAQSAGELPTHLMAKNLANLMAATVQGGYVLSRIHQDPKPMGRAIDGLITLLQDLSAQNQT